MSTRSSPSSICETPRTSAAGSRLRSSTSPRNQISPRLLRESPESLGSGSVRGGCGEGEVARVLVVDDQKVFRDVLRAVVEATPRLRLVGEAACAEDGLLALDALSPEFVILDIRMP